MQMSHHVATLLPRKGYFPTLLYGALFRRRRNSNIVVLLRGRSGLLGPLLLGVEDGLELGRGVEARVVGVLLVEVVVGLGRELRGQIIEDGLQDAVDGLLPGGVAVPDGDEVGVEADRQADAADLVPLVEGLLQLLADGHELDARPEVRAGGLGDAEGPAAAQDVAAVLPDGAEAALEEVDGLAHLDLVHGRVVGVPPEVLHRLDLRPQLLQRRLVDAVVAVLLLFFGLSR